MDTIVEETQNQMYSMDAFIQRFERCIAASRKSEVELGMHPDAIHDCGIADVCNHVLALQYDARCGLDDKTHSHYVKIMGDVFDLGGVLALLLLANIFTPGEIFALDFSRAAFLSFWCRVRGTIPQDILVEATRQSEASDIIPNLFMAEAGTRYDELGNLMPASAKTILERPRRRSFIGLLRRVARGKKSE